MGLRSDQRGSVTVVTALAATSLLGAAAIGLDLSVVYSAQRRAQGAADLAAISAASDPSVADAAAKLSLAANGYPDSTRIGVQAGSFLRDVSIASDKRFTPGGASPNAVRVSLTAPVRLTFGRVLGLPATYDVAVTSTAANTRFAAFSIGSGAASLNAGIANAVLGSMLGTTLSLSALDYDALLSARLDAFRFLDALATDLNLTAATYTDILTAGVTPSQIAGALSGALASTAAATNASTALRSLTQALKRSTDRIPLRDIVDELTPAEGTMLQPNDPTPKVPPTSCEAGRLGTRARGSTPVSRSDALPDSATGCSVLPPTRSDPVMSRSFQGSAEVPRLYADAVAGVVSQAKLPETYDPPPICAAGICGRRLVDRVPAVRSDADAEVAGQRADIGALAAFGGQHRAVALMLDHREMIDAHRAGHEFHHLTIAGEIVGALTLDLDGGEARRNLLDLADEGRQGRLDRLSGRTDVARGDRAPLGVVGIGLDAPGHLEAVGLAAVHDEGDRLGRLTEGDRQDAGGQRVEGAGMAGLLGIEQALHHRHGLGRSDADALVEHHPAAHVVLLRPVVTRSPALGAASAPRRTIPADITARPLRHLDGAFGRNLVLHPVLDRRVVFDGLVPSRARAGPVGKRTAWSGRPNRDQSREGESGSASSSSRGALSRSRWTLSLRSRRSMRAASSKVSSRRKRSSGAYFRFTRRATS